MLTSDQLQRIMPRADAARWLDTLNDAMGAREIDSPIRRATFLAHVAVESGELSTMAENLSYSANRLMQVWPGRFPTAEAAAPFANDPQKLGNLVYADRLGNGPPESGDGFRYRGRGLLQATGKDHYAEAAAALGVDLVATPELLEQPQWAAREAAWWWFRRKLNAVADAQNFRHSTYVINGGYTALDDRLAYWRRGLGVLGADSDGTDRGEIVYQVQKALNANGAAPQLTLDADWGARSEAAAARFRAENHLDSAEGIDAQLLTALGLNAFV